MWGVLRENLRNETDVYFGPKFKQAVFDYPSGLSERGLSEVNHTEILDLTSGCSKTAYIDYENKLDAFLALADQQSEHLSYYMKGDEKLFGDWTGFGLTKGVGTQRMYERMQELMSSGIYGLWEKWYQIQFPDQWAVVVKEAKRKAAVSAGEPKALVLNSNLRTAFIIYIIVCSSAISAFVFEKAWNERRLLRKWLDACVRAWYFICNCTYTYRMCIDVFLTYWKPPRLNRRKELRALKMSSEECNQKKTRAVDTAAGVGLHMTDRVPPGTGPVSLTCH
jgi:hypothetical protein